MDYLEIQKNTEITDDGICYIHSLTKLNVISCVNVTSRGLQMIADNNPNLERLEAKQLELVDDEAVCYLIDKCPRLSILNLSFTNVSSKVLEAAANTGQMKLLNLGNCPNVLPADQSKVHLFP